MPSNIFVAIFYAMIIAGIYAIFYYFNHKTPLPKGCENLNAECDGCKINLCELHPNNRIKEESDD